MRTLEYLADPLFRGLYLPGLLAGLAVCLLGAALSPLVVLKRMAFIGQGVSHAAFGGIGVAAILALAGPAQFALVLLFCIAAALAIAYLSDQRSLNADTAIGIVLVASMALGAVLLSAAFDAPSGGAGAAGRVQGWESILFGDLLSIGPADAALAWAVALGIIAVLAWFRRPILFWAFDEPAAAAFGVATRPVRLLLLVLFAVAIVASMRLAGVILATAILVLPGAVALQLSARLGAVVGLSFAVAGAGVVGGLIASFELGWPPGPSIVGVLVLLFAAARTSRAVAMSPAPA